MEVLFDIDSSFLVEPQIAKLCSFVNQNLRSTCSAEIWILFLENAPVQLSLAALVYDLLRILTVCAAFLCFLKVRSFDLAIVFQIDPLFRQFPKALFALSEGISAESLRQDMTHLPLGAAARKFFTDPPSDGIPMPHQIRSKSYHFFLFFFV